MHTFFFLNISTNYEHLYKYCVKISICSLIYLFVYLHRIGTIQSVVFTLTFYCHYKIQIIVQTFNYFIKKDDYLGINDNFEYLNQPISKRVQKTYIPNYQEN